MSVNPLNEGAPSWAALPKPDDWHDPPIAVGMAAPDTLLPADKGVSWFNRSLPVRMLETALRLLQSSDGARSDARRYHADNTAAHEHTQQLVRELGCMLNQSAIGGVSNAIRANPAKARLPSPAPMELERAPAVASAGPESDAIADRQPPPSLEIYLLSAFRVFANDHAIEDWPNCKGRSIFKYMAIRRGQPVPREVLMAVFWPDADQDSARNNLNVAMHGLRRALARGDAEFPFVLFRQGCYSFNPALRMWVDAEAFVKHIERAQASDQIGNPSQAMAHYREALATYRSALLVDDRYEDWLIPKRQSLQDSYLHALNRLAAHYYAEGDFEACAAVTAKMLEVDPCDEEAHRQMMRCYSNVGQTQLALRQYHFCVDALSRELNLIPSPHTVALFHQIRRREAV